MCFRSLHPQVARLVRDGSPCSDAASSVADTVVSPEFGEVLGDDWTEVVVLRFGALHGGESAGRYGHWDCFSIHSS